MILNLPASFFLAAKRLSQGSYSAIRNWRERFERIAEHGRDGFYKGETAAAILKLERELGGFMQAEDLSEFQPEWVDPVSTTYHGWTVYEMPPNGQGIAALEMLNIMEQFPIKEWGHNSQKSLHLEIEAKKLAYADLQRYVGDPHATHIPTEALISKDLAKQRAKLITDKAACNVLPSDVQQGLAHLSSDTTYLAVVDRDGNEVSLIQSNAGAFGGGLVAPGTGFPLQNRGGGFTLEPGRPNTLRPRTRPLHTIIPAFMQSGDRRIAFGIMGGFNQAQAHAQFVSNVVDFGMNIQAALEAARFTKRDFAGCGVWVENGVAPDVIAGLRSQGHDVKVGPAISRAWAGATRLRRATPLRFTTEQPIQEPTEKPCPSKCPFKIRALDAPHKCIGCPIA